MSPPKIEASGNDSRGRMWERLNAHEQNIAVLQVGLKNLESGQNDLKQDVRELLRQVGEISRRGR